MLVSRNADAATGADAATDVDVCESDGACGTVFSCVYMSVYFLQIVVCLYA